jgi:hypothetical protein
VDRIDDLLTVSKKIPCLQLIVKLTPYAINAIKQRRMVMKNKGKLSAFCLVLTLGVIFLLHAHAVQAKTIEFTFANIFPPTHIQSILNESWAKEVEKRSNGQVKIN